MSRKLPGQDDEIDWLKKKIADQDLRTKKKFGEMMERFEEQEALIGKQEQRVSNQDVKISELEETILRSCSEAHTTLDHPGCTHNNPGERSHHHCTGGVGISDVEVYPKSQSCSLPPLPSERYGHKTFVASEPTYPTPLVATCGGVTDDGQNSCLVWSLTMSSLS